MDSFMSLKGDRNIDSARLKNPHDSVYLVVPYQMRTSENYMPAAASTQIEKTTIFTVAAIGATAILRHIAVFDRDPSCKTYEDPINFVSIGNSSISERPAHDSYEEVEIIFNSNSLGRKTVLSGNKAKHARKLLLDTCFRANTQNTSCPESLLGLIALGASTLNWKISGSEASVTTDLFTLKVSIGRPIAFKLGLRVYTASIRLGENQEIQVNGGLARLVFKEVQKLRNRLPIHPLRHML